MGVNLKNIDIGEVQPQCCECGICLCGAEKLFEKLRIHDVSRQSEQFYCGKHYYHCEGRCDNQCNDCKTKKLNNKNTHNVTEPNDSNPKWEGFRIRPQI